MEKTHKQQRINKKRIIKFIFLPISSFRLLPHWVIFNLSKKRNIINDDIKIWLKSFQLENLGVHVGFFFLMTYYPEYRNLFYKRIGYSQFLVKFLCRPMNTLFLYTKDIGPGLMIWHGFSTILHAKSVGKNCTIRQQITVGNLGNQGGDFPTIGDNVEIGAGAIIIGDIKIGSNSIIGAGSVVTKSVPDNCFVAGVPAYIIRKNGIKTKEKL